MSAPDITNQKSTVNCTLFGKKKGCKFGDDCRYQHSQVVIAPALPKDTSVRTNKQCQFFNKGGCRKGSTCAFLHDNSVKAQTPCRNITNGYCTYGDNCYFGH